MSRIADKLRSQDAARPSLSLAMIVKDEADTLDTCLASARPHVDEIVVVDTGSTDGSQEIARPYADTFKEIEWPDSFAEARNRSFDLATGDYIMYLDGDEYMPDAAHWRELRRTLSKPDVAVVQILIRNLLSEGQVVAADCFWQERVMRNHPYMRFIGRVHNQIHEGIERYVDETGEKVVRVEAEVVHTGYALPGAEKKEKYRKRLHLLKAEYESPRSSSYRAYYGFQLGVAHSILEEPEKALEVFSEINYDEMTDENAFYGHLLAAKAALELETPSRALVHTECMLALNRHEPIGYYISGYALLKAGQAVNGLLMLIRAYELSEETADPVRFELNVGQLLHAVAEACRSVGLTDFAARLRLLSEKDDRRPELVRALITTLTRSIVEAEANTSAA